MLARLDAIPGVVESRVEASGRLFALALSGEADEAAVLAAAAEALRAPPRRLPPGAAAAQLVARASGDPWYGRGEVAALCFVEARVLAVRGEAAVAAAAGLDRAAGAAVGEAIRGVLFEAMARVLAEGGRDSSGWFYLEWPALAAEVARRCAPALPPERRDAVAAALRALHAR